ncbi:MAG: LptF/LptG family permease [Gammaproteobacteria bacterium AqS3]|nr:LptF/LptG family permease [Gammaproteobacteria bacterium AqS3]
MLFVSGAHRHLCLKISAGIAGALALLVLLDGLFIFIAELTELTGGYTIVGALAYTAGVAPHRTLLLLPHAVLLGTVWSISQLQMSGELIGMRSIGLSKMGVLRTGLIAVVGCSALAFVLSEAVVPATLHATENQRAERLGRMQPDESAEGHWLKDRQGRQSSTFVHIARWSDARILNDASWFEFRDGELDSVVRAEQAEHRGDGWLLRGVRRQRLRPGEAPTTERLDTLQIRSAITPEIIRTTAVPDQLTLNELLDFDRYQRRTSEVEYGEHILMLMQRLAMPLQYGVMALLALAFCLGGAIRMRGAGRIVLAITAGLIIELIQDIAALSSLAYQYHPGIAVAAPLAVLGALGIRELRRV